MESDQEAKRLSKALGNFTEWVQMEGRRKKLNSKFSKKNGPWKKLWLPIWMTEGVHFMCDC